MTRFAVVRSIDVLADLTEGLDAWARVRSPFAMAPRPLAGLWIEHPNEAHRHEPALHDLQTGPAKLRLQMGPGPWSVCVTSATLGRTELASALIEAWGGASTTRARFVPVFGAADHPDAVADDWQRLVDRYAGLVLPPMLSDDAGRLLFAKPTTEALVAVASSRRRGLGPWLEGLA